MAGQGTVAVEILNDIETEPHYLFASVGGGGLLSGVGNLHEKRVPGYKADRG
jgi:threonine dehydratase